ncbi:MAG: hypothetical protein KDD89_00745 [Anaerolineales bacterium]|nr:hypothetical protein [Anaerolineales bacterium]
MQLQHDPKDERIGTPPPWYNTMIMIVAGALWVATLMTMIWYYHSLDKLLFQMNGNTAPFFEGFMTYYGWGVLHVPSFVFGLAVVLAALAAPHVAKLVVYLVERLLATQVVLEDAEDDPVIE